MAKKITIPESRELTGEEYLKIYEHLRNSAIWYATNMNINSAQIIEKLQKKGLTSDPVHVTYADGARETHYLIDETLAFLQDALLVDDEAYAKRLIEIGLSQGKGFNAIRSTLHQKKVDPELINRLIEEMEEGDESKEMRQEALEKAYRRALTSQAYKKELAKVERGEWGSPRSALSRSMASRGFSFSEISDFLDELEVELDG